LLIKIRIKRHKCLHPFSSLLIADIDICDHDIFDIDPPLERIDVTVTHAAVGVAKSVGAVM